MKNVKSNTTKESKSRKRQPKQTIAPSEARWTIRVEGWGKEVWHHVNNGRKTKIESFACKSQIVRVTLPWLPIDEALPLIREVWKDKSLRGLEKVAFLYDWDDKLLMRWTKSANYKKYHGKNINYIERAKNQD